MDNTTRIVLATLGVICAARGTCYPFHVSGACSPEHTLGQPGDVVPDRQLFIAVVPGRPRHGSMTIARDWRTAPEGKAWK